MEILLCNILCVQLYNHQLYIPIQSSIFGILTCINIKKQTLYIKFQTFLDSKLSNIAVKLAAAQ